MGFKFGPSFGVSAALFRSPGWIGFAIGPSVGVGVGVNPVSLFGGSSTGILVDPVIPTADRSWYDKTMNWINNFPSFLFSH